MAVANPQKGVNFKQTPQKKLLLIHPPTFAAYVATLPVYDGTVSLSVEEYRFLSHRNLFATVNPATANFALPEGIERRALNFIETGPKKLLIVDLGLFHHQYRAQKEWVAFQFIETGARPVFATLSPEVSRSEHRRKRDARQVPILTNEQRQELLTP